MARGTDKSLFEMLIQESAALSVYLDLPTLLDSAMLRIRRQLSAECVSYFAVQGDNLRRVAHICSAEKPSVVEEYPIGEGLVGLAFENLRGIGVGTPLVRNEPGDWQAQLTARYAVLATDLSSQRIAHIAVVSIGGPGGPLGVLRVVNKVENGQPLPEGFSQEDVSRLRVLAGAVLLRVAEIDQASAETIEIHEALNSLHAGVLLRGELLMQEVEELGYHDQAAQLEQLLDAARFTYLQLTAVVHERYSSILRKDGLVVVLENYARQVAPTMISVKGPKTVRFAPTIERALYGIAVGAISNALTHAGLDEVPGGGIDVSIDVEFSRIRLCVRDNGRGFDTGSVNLASGVRGLSLMRQKARSIGGTFVVTSEPSKGTEVRVDIPIEVPL